MPEDKVEQKLRFLPRQKLIDLELSQEDRQFIEERNVRQRNAGKSGRKLCG